MNSLIKDLLDNQETKINIMKEEEKKLYKAGIGILGICINEDFFDIEKLPENKYEDDGLYYNIPYYDDTVLWSTGGNQVDIVVVYEIKNKSSFCPLRISFNYKDEKNYNIDVHFQRGTKSIKRELFASENSVYYTSIMDYKTIKLSELVNHTYNQLN